MARKRRNVSVDTEAGSPQRATKRHQAVSYGMRYFSPMESRFARPSPMPDQNEQEPVDDGMRFTLPLESRFARPSPLPEQSEQEPVSDDEMRINTPPKSRFDSPSPMPEQSANAPVKVKREGSGRPRKPAFDDASDSSDDEPLILKYKGASGRRKKGAAAVAVTQVDTNPVKLRKRRPKPTKRERAHGGLVESGRQSKAGRTEEVPRRSRHQSRLNRQSRIANSKTQSDQSLARSGEAVHGKVKKKQPQVLVDLVGNEVYANWLQEIKEAENEHAVATANLTAGKGKGVEEFKRLENEVLIKLKKWNVVKAMAVMDATLAAEHSTSRRQSLDNGREGMDGGLLGSDERRVEMRSDRPSLAEELANEFEGMHPERVRWLV